MRNHILRSPLALLQAASLAVFIVFVFIGRVAIACADPQIALNQGAQDWYGTGSGSDRAPTERALSMEPGRYRSRYGAGLARGAGAAIRAAKIARLQAVHCLS